MNPVIQRFINQDAELRVIGSALIDPEAIAKVSRLKSDDFYNMAHRNIWDAIVGLGKFADWGTITAWLERRGLLPEVQSLTGDLSIYLATNAMQSIPTALNIEQYAADVFDMARRRELNSALEKAATANLKGEPLPTIGGKIISTLSAMEPAGKRQTLAEAIAEYSAEREAERDGTRTAGIPSGIGDLDRLTDGWRPGNLVTVTGPTSGGKTTLMLGFALEAAKRDYKTIFIGMEMSNAVIVRKAVAALSSVATGHTNLRAMTPEKWEREQEAMNMLAGLPFIPVDAPGATLGAIAEIIHKENTKGQVGLVIVDHLQAMSIEGGKNESRATQVGAVTRTLKALAGQAKCAILLGAQLNREAGMTDEPQLKHLKESSSIEQDSNMVMMIHDPQDKASPMSRTLFVRKNRNGPQGSVPLVARWDISRLIGAARETIEL